MVVTRGQARRASNDNLENVRKGGRIGGIASTIKDSSLLIVPCLGLVGVATLASHHFIEGVVERTFLSSVIICSVLAGLAYKDTIVSLFSGSDDSFIASLLTPERQQEFATFQRNFLIVQLLATFIDFIQGPYLYSIYKGYGYAMSDIALLYLIGFGSSALMSPVAGVIADTYGRRLGCMIFAFLQATSCLLLHYNNYAILGLGRFLSGIATSFLSTCFECWMVAEHNRKKFPEELLGNTFSTYIFLMGVTAVASGTVAGWAEAKFGMLGPFDVCTGTAILQFCFIPLVWRSENYGEAATKEEAVDSRKSGTVVKEVLNVFFGGKKEVLWIGLTQAFFEVAMFTWIFIWTPALDTGDIASLNLGLVFSTFMVGVMIGSSSFRILTGKDFQLSNETVLLGALFLGTASLIFCVLTTRADWLLIAFVLYEACVGVYFAASGSIRARFVPEGQRATIMNAIRVLLNVLVVIMYRGPLYWDLEMSVKRPLVLSICSAFVLLASLSHAKLMSTLKQDETQEKEL